MSPCTRGRRRLALEVTLLGFYTIENHEVTLLVHEGKTGRVETQYGLILIALLDGEKFRSQ